MLREFSRYEVEITNEAFADSTLNLPLRKTSVRFFDDTGTLVAENTMGYLPKEDFHKLLDSKAHCLLQDIYLRDVSIPEYFDSRKEVDGKANVLPECEFLNCVFDTSDNHTTDFSRTVFLGSAMFNRSLFLGKTSFFDTSFMGKEVSFEYCLFKGGEHDFSSLKAKHALISFKNAIFRAGEKKFENMQCGKGSIIFQNTEFGDGDVSFHRSHFGEDITSFKVSRFGTGRKNFDHARFGPGDANFERVDFGNGNISFKSAVFHDCVVDFTRSTFGEGQKIFVSTDFGKGHISFVNTTFGEGKASFRSARFQGETVDFHYSVFSKGEIVFERTDFGNAFVDFRSVRFNDGTVSFYRSIFGHQDIDFEASECCGKIKFEQTEFGVGKLNFHTVEYDKADVLFEHINFNNNIVSFNLSRVKSLTFRSCEFNKYFDLRVAHCGKMDFTESIIRDIVDINPYENYFNVDILDFSGLILLGRIYIDWRKAGLREKIYSLQTDDRNRSEQFRMLKQNYYTIGNYEYEDLAYIEFKRAEMKADLQESVKDNPYTAPFAYIKYGFVWLTLDKTGRFATNPVRVLQSMIIIYFFYSCLYFIMPMITDTHISTVLPDAEPLSAIAKGFYFSGVSFFTIGYGDYYPIGSLRWIAITEGFLGVFMMSYLAVAFVRKILR